MLYAQKYIDIFYWEKFRHEGSRIRLKENKKKLEEYNNIQDLYLTHIQIKEVKTDSC